MLISDHDINPRAPSYASNFIVKRRRRCHHIHSLLFEQLLVSVVTFSRINSPELTNKIVFHSRTSFLVRHDTSMSMDLEDDKNDKHVKDKNGKIIL